MTTADWLYLALIVCLLLLDHFVLWPAFVRRSHAGHGRPRVWLWSGWMIFLWTMVAAGVALWRYEGRAWAALRLIPPHGWRLWSAVGLVLALAAAHAQMVARIARPRRRRIKMGNTHVQHLIPRNRSELGWWVALSLTAGFCEEFVFRGYLLWVFQPVLGLWGAAAVSGAVFAAAHAYQGAKGILATGIVGAVLTLIVLVSGSLLPAMAVHALIDIGQGVIAWLVVRQGSGTVALEDAS